MPKITSPTKSRSYISTSSDSGSESDSSHSSSGSSASEKSKKSVIIRPKSRSPPPQLQPPAVKKEEPPPSPLKPTKLQNSNFNGIQKTKLHEEHVAILDKLSSNMRFKVTFGGRTSYLFAIQEEWKKNIKKESESRRKIRRNDILSGFQFQEPSSDTHPDEVKRGLALLNTCVNELAQTKWILVNVERTLDEFYEECPVCRSADDDGPGPGLGGATAKADKSVPENEAPQKESHVKDKTHDSHDHDSDSDGEKKKSHKLPPMPMGRSGCNFSKHSTSTKYKHKEKKISSKEFTKTKTESIKTSPAKKEVKSLSTKVPETSNKTVVPVPAKYKAGPRSKTRPLENLLDQPAPPGSTKSSPPPANIPITTEMTEAQIKYLRALIKEGSSVKVNLKDVSCQLNGRTKLKDWRKLDQKEEDDVESNASKKVSSTQKSKTYKVSSDSDENEALIKLKRKREEVSEKSSSKKHKSSSHSHSRSHSHSHHSKDKYKHSSEKEKSSGSSKDKHSKTKSADSVKKDRKSVDSHHSHSHSSGKERKSIDSLPGSKHRKTEDSGSARRDSKSSEHKEKDDKHLKRDSEAKIRKLSDPGSDDLHKSVSEVSVKSVKSTNEQTKITKSEEIIPVVDKVVTQDISSQPEPEPEQVKPIPAPTPAAVVAAATLQKVPVASKEAIFKLLQEKFQKFNQSKRNVQQPPPQVQPAPAPVPVSTSSEVSEVPQPQETESSKTVTTDLVPSTLTDADVDNVDAKSTKSDPSAASTSERRAGSQVEVSTTQEIEKETAPTVEAMDVENCTDEAANIDSEKEPVSYPEIKEAIVSKEAEITSTDDHSLVLAQDDAMEIKDNTFKEILQSLDLDGI